MAILRDRNGIFYDIPERELKKYAVPPKKIKQLLKREPLAGGQVGRPEGPPFGPPMRPSTIVINLGPLCGEGRAGETAEGGEEGDVRAHSSSACWRKSCACWRRSCSCKK